MLVLAAGTSLVQAQSKPALAGGELRQKYEIEVRDLILPENLCQPLPAYNATLQRARVQGTVVVRGLIDERGRMQGVRLESGHPVLGRAASLAVSQWRFRPALLRDKPVVSDLTVVFNFILGGEHGSRGAAMTAQVVRVPQLAELE